MIFRRGIKFVQLLRSFLFQSFYRQNYKGMEIGGPILNDLCETKFLTSLLKSDAGNNS